MGLKKAGSSAEELLSLLTECDMYCLLILNGGLVTIDAKLLNQIQNGGEDDYYNIFAYKKNTQPSIAKFLIQ